MTDKQSLRLYLIPDTTSQTTSKTSTIKLTYIEPRDDNVFFPVHFKLTQQLPGIMERFKQNLPCHDFITVKNELKQHYRYIIELPANKFTFKDLCDIIVGRYSSSCKIKDGTYDCPIPELPL